MATKLSGGLDRLLDRQEPALHFVENHALRELSEGRRSAYASQHFLLVPAPAKIGAAIKADVESLRREFLHGGAAIEDINSMPVSSPRSVMGMKPDCRSSEPVGGLIENGNPSSRIVFASAALVGSLPRKNTCISIAMPRWVYGSVPQVARRPLATGRADVAASARLGPSLK